MLEQPDYRAAMVEHNYQLARRYYSYTELRRRLRMLIGNIGNLYPPEAAGLPPAGIGGDPVRAGGKLPLPPWP